MGNNISKQVGGPIKADEIKWVGVQKKDDGAAEALATALGGGVTKPVPVAFPWTIYTVSSTEDDDKPGIYCLSVWDVPKDTMGLKLKYSYVKRDGTYGRVKWFPSYRLDDQERSTGRVELQFGPIRPNSRLDIVRAVAVKRAARDVGNPPLTQDDRRGKGTTPAYTPTALPTPSGFDTPPYANQISDTPLSMATILTGDYIVGYPRILSVDSPQKEVDGIYFPVTISSTDNIDLLISVRMGVFRVGTKAGGANSYSRRIATPRIDLTEEQMAELADVGHGGGRTVVMVGPLKANKKYHIRWIRGRYSLDPDDSSAKVIRHRWPLANIVSGVDETLNYLPNATTPVYSLDNVGTAIDPVPGGADDTPPLTDPAPFLAVLSPTGDITVAPSNPNASDIIKNEPDIETEKDKDAIIVLRFWAAEANRALYLINPTDTNMTSFEEANVTKAAVVMRNILPDASYRQKHHPIEIEDPSAYFVDITFHRQIGRSLQWVKNISFNEADREVSSTVNLAFTAGATGDHTKITSFAIAITNDADDNRQADASITFTNDATNPAVPKRIVILRSLSTLNTGPPTTLTEINNGKANWKPVFKKNLRADSESLATSGSKILKFTIPGVTLSKGIRYYRAFMFLVGDATWVEAFDDNTGTGGEQMLDTVAPGACGAVKIKFKHGNLRCKTLAPSPSTTDGNQNILSYTWVINNQSTYNNPGSTYLTEAGTDPEITVASGTPTLTFVTSGTTLNLPVRKHLMSSFGTIYCHVFATNNIGSNTTTITNSSIAYTSLVSGVYNDDEDIPLRRTFHGRRNLIIGGNCANSAAQFGSGTGTEKLGKHFFKLPTSGNIDIDANRINATIPPAGGYFPFYWNKANHTVAHINSGTAATPGGFLRAIAIRLSGKGRPFEVRDVLSLTWKARGIAGTETPDWDIWLLQDDRTAKSVVYSVTSSVTSTNWTTFVCELEVNAAITAGRFFYIAMQEQNAAAADYHMDHFCAVRGRQGALWEGTEEEENLAPENTAAPVVGAGLTSATVKDCGAGLGQDSVALYSGTVGGAITL